MFKLRAWLPFAASMLILAACGGSLASPPTAETPLANATFPSPPLLPEKATPQDLGRYLEAWPASRKLAIDQDIIAVFHYPHPAVLWDETASIYHVSSMSRVDLRRGGEVAITEYSSDEGRRQLERVLADTALMEQIRELIPWDAISK